MAKLTVWSTAAPRALAAGVAKWPVATDVKSIFPVLACALLSAVWIFWIDARQPSRQRIQACQSALRVHILPIGSTSDASVPRGKAQRNG
jgi:hypothetical protein